MDNRAKCVIHGNRFIIQGTYLVAAPAKRALPRITGFFVDHRDAHSDIPLIAQFRVECAGWADWRAFHAEITRNLARIDNGGAHVGETVKERTGPHGPVRADYETFVAADAARLEMALIARTGRAEKAFTHAPRIPD